MTTVRRYHQLQPSTWVFTACVVVNARTTFAHSATANHTTSAKTARNMRDTRQSKSASIVTAKSKLVPAMQSAMMYAKLKRVQNLLRSHAWRKSPVDIGVVDLRMRPSVCHVFTKTAQRRAKRRPKVEVDYLMVLMLMLTVASASLVVWGLNRLSKSAVGTSSITTASRISWRRNGLRHASLLTS